MSETQTPNLQTERFETATEEGEIINKGGYHQPRGGRRSRVRGCGCSLTTSKGAYRDVSVRMPDGRVIHYYHQSPVVVENGTHYRVSSCGYHTMTTKERINDHTPRGYYVRQEDYTWYVETPDGDRVEFDDGMILPDDI